MLLCTVAVLRAQVWKHLFVYLNSQLPKPELKTLPFYRRTGSGTCLLNSPGMLKRYVTSSWQFFSPSLDNLQGPLNTRLLISFKRMHAPVRITFTYIEKLRKIFMKICLENIQSFTLDNLHFILWFGETIVKTFIGIMSKWFRSEIFKLNNILMYLCWPMLMDLIRKSLGGTFLAVQWLRFYTSTTGDVGSIPGICCIFCS